MHKRYLLGLLLLLALCLVALPAVANTTDAVKPDLQQGNLQWLEQRFEAQKSNIDRLVKDGNITAEQGQAMKKQLEQNYELHRQGQPMPMGGGQGHGMKNRGMGNRGADGGFGGCGGQGMGMGTLGQNGACPYYPAK